MKFSESLEGTFVPSLDDVRSLAAEANIGGLLNYVNLAFPHRITAFFELVDGMFFCRSLYDKRSAMTAAEQKPIPSQDSLCEFAMDRGAFLMLNSDRDDRATSKPIHEEIKSYLGVALSDEHGQLWGTLSTYDFEPQTRISLDRYDFYKACGGILSDPLISHKLRQALSVESAPASRST